MHFEILNAIAKPILVIDIDYRIVATNSMACNSFCSSPDNIIGQECFKITHKTDKPCWHYKIDCPVRAAFESKEKVTAIHEHNIAGKAVLEEITAVPVLDDQGEVLFVVEELNDITELVQSREVIDHLKSEISALESFLPICSNCKRIRKPDSNPKDMASWERMESYITQRTSSHFSHSICPECMKKLYGDIMDENQ
ncbi:MAG: PAS domain-containing protein [Spirochaetales bacterium]|nr:PAS domain-containing protein [Spirochaetales bacterium]